jgi:uncharacterized protein (DUF736 family)
MAIIGTFQRDGEGFSGHIATLSLNIGVQFTKPSGTATTRLRTSGSSRRAASS